MSETNFIPRKIAILGAGVMGAQIAAHCVNAGFETYLFDLADKSQDKNTLVDKAIKALAKLKPAPLATSSYVGLLKAMNYDEDLARLVECDLIIEAIAERLDWKVDLYEKIVPHVNKNAILATNTSGLSINSLDEILPQELKPRFCGIHFFNPPRYMHLAELIPSDNTEENLLDKIETFLVSYLGKGVVRAKDTPNFIANRIGVFSLIATMYHTDKFNLSFDEVDALTGVLVGRPKSATFRTMDVVGLDTMGHVVNTMQQLLKQDPWHQHFTIPSWLQVMIDNGLHGQKSGCGIYKKQGKEIHVFCLASNDYKKSQGKVDEQVKQILMIKDVKEKFKQLSDCQHPQAQFLIAVFSDLFHYCAHYLSSIADTVRDVDLAIRWGFGWDVGPFETWQLAGFKEMTQLLQSRIEQRQAMSTISLPSWLDSIDSFYQKGRAYSASDNSYKQRRDLPVYKRQLFKENVLTEINSMGKTVYENDGVALWHQGDGIAILSFKSKLNAVGDSVLDGIMQAIAIAEQSYKALVIYQHSDMNFSVGANLKEFSSRFALDKAHELEAIVEKFQNVAMRLKYSAIPSIAAVRGRALGGGCELAMQCDKVVAGFESYIGLVEIGVGLLPAGGGLKEFALRAARDRDSYAAIESYFKTVAMAEVSASSIDAKCKGYMRDDDVVVMNNHEVLFVAKTIANAMSQSNYKPPMKKPIPVAGRLAISRLQMLLANMREGGFISEHDYLITCKIADVICGGDLNSGELVDEQWFLRKERKAFVELACLEKTQARVMHMLETGKPLRN
jgi:3-hydroxyacyl-CoA dehydrogenase